MKRWICLLTLVLACGDSPTEQAIIQPPTRVTLDKIAGDNQTDTVARRLATPLQVQVNQIGPTITGPLPGVLVNFVALDGSVFAGAAITDSFGRAADIWTLGTSAGPQRLEVRAVDADGKPVTYDTFTAMGMPGRPASLTIALGDTLLFLGERLSVASLPISGVDDYGNPIASPRVTVNSTTLSVSGDTVWSDVEAFNASFEARSGLAISNPVWVNVVRDLNLNDWLLTWMCPGDGLHEVVVDSVAYDSEVTMYGLPYRRFVFQPISWAGWQYAPDAIRLHETDPRFGGNVGTVTNNAPLTYQFERPFCANGTAPELIQQ